MTDTNRREFLRLAVLAPIAVKTAPSIPNFYDFTTARNAVRIDPTKPFFAGGEVKQYVIYFGRHELWGPSGKMSDIPEGPG